MTLTQEDRHCLLWEATEPKKYSVLTNCWIFNAKESGIYDYTAYWRVPKFVFSCYYTQYHMKLEQSVTNTKTSLKIHKNVLYNTAD